MAGGRLPGFGGGLLLALGCGFAVPSQAGTPDLCSGQPAAMQQPCREALKLLVQGGPQEPEPEPARRILATGTPEGWRYDYVQPGGMGPDDACVVAGELVVPADTPVRLLVTASDTIRPWRLPQFGLALTGVPGRIEEATVKLPAGEAGGGASAPGAGEQPVAVRVLAPEAYAEWEGKTLPPSCFASG
ncbi:hypothetical protein [Bosea sp. (in: a-proteobacteria)]|uniref:hypothetical protein n=1 Tax=Bosea sp. (in: a-proteobacteria) TaxID=1871050 RepID=UPI003342B805